MLAVASRDPRPERTSRIQPPRLDHFSTKFLILQMPNIFSHTIFDTFPYLLPCSTGAVVGLLLCVGLRPPQLCVITFVWAFFSLPETLHITVCLNFLKHFELVDWSEISAEEQRLVVDGAFLLVLMMVHNSGQVQPTGDKRERLPARSTKCVSIYM
jgi:hypothetical protein